MGLRFMTSTSIYFRGRNHTHVAIRNVRWKFLQEHTHPPIQMSSRGSCNSQEFDIDISVFCWSIHDETQGSKVHFKHPLFTHAEYWKSEE